MNQKQKEVLRKIIYAVETGGQIYGRCNYADFTEAYTNSSSEHAITIGAGQWYGEEARQLLMQIKSVSSNGFTEELNRHLDYSWSNLQIRRDSSLAKTIVSVISSEVGRACQDRLLDRQMEVYCNEAESYGVTEPDAQAMCANFRHQGGHSAMKRIISKTNRPYTLDNLYQATLSDTGNQVGAYRSRQKFVYQNIKERMVSGMSAEQIRKSALDWMLDLARDDSHGYSQDNRWGPDYDCSSAIIQSWKQAGVPLSCTYTGDMRQDMLRHGFQDVTGSVNRSNGSGMLPSDVLLNEVHHTAMFVGDGLEVEASVNEKGGAHGGQPGDQTGREILIRPYRNYPWNVVMRYAGSAAFRPLLRSGDKGEIVKTLQKLLNDNGAMLEVDGDFGKLTMMAVMDFQTRHMLGIDGIVGDRTWDELDHQIKKVKKTPGKLRKSPRKVSKCVDNLTAGTEVRVFEYAFNDLQQKWARVADGWIIADNLI